MVLVDSAHEDEYLWLNGRVVRPSSMSEAEWSDLVKPKKPAAPPEASDAQKLAARRPRITKVPAPYDKLPEDAQRLRLWAMSQPFTPQRFEGGDSTDFRSDFLEMDRMRADHSLGKIPLVVLSKTPGVDDDSDYTSEQLKWNRDLQNQLESMSSNSDHVIAQHSGHHIQLEAPDLVKEAIHRVLDSARSGQPLTKRP